MSTMEPDEGNNIVIADREIGGATVVVSSLDEVRDAVLGRSRPGPVV